MVFNTTFNNISAISWRSVLLMEEIWAQLFETFDKVIHWINHLFSGQLLSTGYKYVLSWTTFVQSLLLWIKFYPEDKYDLPIVI